MAGASAVLGRNAGGDDDRRLVSELVGQMKGAGK